MSAAGCADESVARKRRRVIAFAVAGLLVSGALIAGCDSDSGGGGGGDDKANVKASNGNDTSQTSDIGPKVRGTIKDSLFVTGDAEARRNMKITNVWCRWNGDEVEIGATLHNTMATHVTVHIQPNYRLKRAGLHGDGVGSLKDAGVDADQTRVWSEKIGNPDNVDGKPAITECAPELMEVELG